MRRRKKEENSNTFLPTNVIIKGATSIKDLSHTNFAWAPKSKNIRIPLKKNSRTPAPHIMLYLGRQRGGLEGDFADMCAK